MVAAMPLSVLPASPRGGAVDRRVTLHGIGWDQYVSISDAIPEGGGVRLTYLEGALEIMTTGSAHELTKKTAARAIEAYADEMRIPLVGYGNATFRRRARERGLEPDECYAFGRKLAEGEVPDLAIEVVVTHGSIDKLDVYAGLGVPEVWFWEEGAITVHGLGPDGYEARTASLFLPEIDLAELAAVVAAEDQPGALWAYRDRLRERAARRR
jgi:Uma2 family endonuclease